MKPDPDYNADFVFWATDEGRCSERLLHTGLYTTLHVCLSPCVLITVHGMGALGPLHCKQGTRDTQPRASSFQCSSVRNIDGVPTIYQALLLTLGMHQWKKSLALG